VHSLYLDRVENDGRLLFEQIVKMDLEGMVCKRKGSPYRTIEKPSPYWLKVKNPRYRQLEGREEFSSAFPLITHQPGISKDRVQLIRSRVEIECNLVSQGQVGGGIIVFVGGRVTVPQPVEYRITHGGVHANVILGSNVGFLDPGGSSGLIDEVLFD
jgi:hypothetical protein